MTNILSGRAASGGTIKGIAKVILSEEGFADFENGAVLVTKQTSPAWTPLFAVAGGVVTELGGTLSHAAIVAREYGIPAVVGVKEATKLISNGQKVEVRGDKGEVEMV